MREMRHHRPQAAGRHPRTGGCSRAGRPSRGGQAATARCCGWAVTE